MLDSPLPIRPLARRRRPSYGLLFVLPYLAFLLLFGIGPGLYAVLLSFLDGTTPGFRFVGLSNYAAALGNSRLGPAFMHALAFLAIWLPLKLVGAPAVALLLHARPGRFSEAMRLIYYVPSAVSGSAAVLLWIFMFTPSISPFGPILAALGLHSVSDVFAPSRLPLVFAVMSFFTSVGFWIVVLYGALVNIPSEVLEAATIDGANDWQKALYIKLPMISRNLVFMSILNFAGGFQLFVEPQLVNSSSGGALATPYWSPNQLAYSYAFQTGDFGISAAISVGLVSIGFAVALFVIYRTDFYRIDSEGG